MSSSGASGSKTPARGTETQDPLHQVKFLLSVWRNCDCGKINWGPILEEFNINTQGAASKRLERLLKSHDMKVTQVMKNLPPTAKTGSDNGSEPSSAKKRNADGRSVLPKTPAKKQRATKGKSKAVAQTESDVEVDDDADEVMKEDITDESTKLEADEDVDGAEKV